MTIFCTHVRVSEETQRKISKTVMILCLFLEIHCQVKWRTTWKVMLVNANKRGGWMTTDQSQVQNMTSGSTLVAGVW